MTKGQQSLGKGAEYWNVIRKRGKQHAVSVSQELPPFMDTKPWVKVFSKLTFFIVAFMMIITYLNWWEKKINKLQLTGLVNIQNK